MDNSEMQKLYLIPGGKEDSNNGNVIPPKKLTIYGCIAVIAVIVVSVWGFFDLYKPYIANSHPVCVQFLALKVSEVLCAGIVGFAWTLFSLSRVQVKISKIVKNLLKLVLFLCRCYLIKFFGTIAKACFMQELMLLGLGKQAIYSLSYFLIGNGFIWLLLVIGAINFAKSELVYRFLKRLDRCFWSEAK